MGLFLVRHCSAMGQEPEAPLTVEGVDQAKKLADFLCNHGVSRIISSPYCRAIDSARPLATVLKISIETDVRLVERNLGLVSDGDWRAALRESFEKPLLHGGGLLLMNSSTTRRIPRPFLPTVTCSLYWYALLTSRLDSSSGKLLIIQM